MLSSSCASPRAFQRIPAKAAAGEPRRPEVPSERIVPNGRRLNITDQHFDQFLDHLRESAVHLSVAEDSADELCGRLAALRLDSRPASPTRKERRPGKARLARSSGCWQSTVHRLETEESGAFWETLLAAFESENVPGPAMDALASAKEQIKSFGTLGRTDRVEHIFSDFEFGLIMRHFNRVSYQEGFNIEQTLTVAATILENRERVLLNKRLWSLKQDCVSQADAEQVAGRLRGLLAPEAPAAAVAGAR
ncbi:unnamed protein product, partial [Prorocentrum cordatum]